MAYMTTTTKDRNGSSTVVGCSSDHPNYERIKQHAATLDRPVWMFRDIEEAQRFHGEIVDWSACDVVV